MTATRAVVHTIPRLDQHAHANTLRIGVVGPPGQIRGVEARLEAQFGRLIVTHTVAVSAWDVEVVEAFDPAVSKWAGVSDIATRLGVPFDQTIAIGDDMNDLPMIRNAGTGVAMGNAAPAVKAAAAITINANTHDGLAEYLENLVSVGG
jgi:hydroxymethylpyrimidine pyrophosphatase-like HAD family hydrolase